MKLQILIPQYKETDSDIKILLDSISIQQTVDFNELGVIIVNDGSDIKLSDSLLNSYPFKVEYYQNEHKGVSATRNACLEKATADYVMFCDADDMFYNACGIWIIFNEIKIGFDVLVNYFTEQVRLPDKSFTYIDHHMDATFVHGKVYNRKFLEDFNIKWNENYTIHEDSYFNYLCQACAREGQLKLGSTPFYMWRWNDNSVSRHDDKYILKTYNHLLDSSSGLIDELVNRGLIENARLIAVTRLYDSYFTLNKKEWLEQENQEYRKAVEKRFKEFYLKYKNHFEEIDEEQRNKIIIELRNQKYSEGMIMEKITFDDWIDLVLREY